MEWLPLALPISLKEAFMTNSEAEMREEFEALKRAILLIACKAETLEQLQNDLTEILGTK